PWAFLERKMARRAGGPRGRANILVRRRDGALRGGQGIEDGGQSRAIVDHSPPPFATRSGLALPRERPSSLTTPWSGMILPARVRRGSSCGTAHATKFPGPRSRRENLI